jgi:TniB protein
MTTADGLDVELLRRSLERAFKHRKTRQLIVDEAHHILLSHDARHVEMQFESLKSLADTCGATLVLIGTYRLLQIREHSAQLIRRSQIVHFPPYRAAGTDERRAFKSVLATFVQKLPFPLDSELAKDVMFFFLKTAGCVGILRDLLRDAVCEAIESGSTSITRELIERVAQPNKAIKTILQEAALGAYALEDVSIDEVSSLVEKTPKEISESHWREQMGGSGQEFPLVPGGAAPATRRRTTRKVGQRAPNRDRVEGGARAAFL